MRGLTVWSYAPLFRHDSQRRIQRRDAVLAKLVAASAPLRPIWRAGCERHYGSGVENPARVKVSYELCTFVSMLGGMADCIVFCGRFWVASNFSVYLPALC